MSTLLGLEVDEEIILHIGFKIVNSTDMPLTLKEIKLSVQNQDSSLENVLAPKHTYPIEFSILIHGDQITHYFTDKLELTILG